MKTVFVLVLLSLLSIQCESAKYTFNKFLSKSTNAVGGLSLFLMLFIIVIIRHFLIKHFPTIPIEPLVLIIGIFIALPTAWFDIAQEMGSRFRPFILDLVVLPLMVCRICMSMDPNTPIKSWLELIVVLTPGFLFNVSVVGFTLRIMEDRNWLATQGLMMGFVALPIYPTAVHNILREQGRTCKTVTTVILAETIVSLICTQNAVYLINCTYLMIYQKWYHYVVFIFNFITFAIFVGWLIGKGSVYLLNKIATDPVSITLTSISTCLLSYGVCSFLNVSGTVGLVVSSIMVNRERSTNSSYETETFLIMFWDLLVVFTNCFMLITFGNYIGATLVWSSTMFDFGLIIIIYVSYICGRIITYLIMAPLLNLFFGYGLSVRQTVVAIWSGTHSGLNLVMLSQNFYIKQSTQLVAVLVLHISGLIIFSNFCHVPTFPWLLDCLGLTSVSPARMSNMTNSIRHLLAIRDRCLNMFKLDKLLSDANWPVVVDGTEVKHPYKDISAKEMEQEHMTNMTYRTVVCNNCKLEVEMPPSESELKEMNRDMRRKVLKARRVNYARQFEGGMLSPESYRILTSCAMVDMEARNIFLRPDCILPFFKKKSIFERIRMLLASTLGTKTLRIRPPNNYWKRKLYHLINNIKFEILVLIIVVINVIEISIGNFNIDSNQSHKEIFFYINVVFCIFYVIEFLIRIFAVSTPRVIPNGFSNYFKSHWNKFDFFILVITITATAFETAIVLHIFKAKNLMDANWSVVSTMVRLTRLIRILRIFSFLYPTIETIAEMRMRQMQTQAYDIGKGYLTGENEIIHILHQFTTIGAMKEEIRLEMEAGIATVVKQHGLIQKKYPSIPINVKTRQAINIILNGLNEGVVQLKSSGWIEESERQKLLDTIDIQAKVANRLRNIPMNSPRSIFEQISWMSKDPAVIDLIFNNAVIKIFSPGDLICKRNENPPGIYVIISGLSIFRVIYKPLSFLLDDLGEYGMLPIVDHISSPMFDEPHTEYTASGHTIGELCFLTGRPYDSEVTADAHSKVYLIPNDILAEVRKIESDPIKGLDARMWTSISMRMAQAILQSAPTYRTSTPDAIRFLLERSVMPYIGNIKVFVRTEVIEDIILIEGVTFDLNTRDVYTAPTFIPRNVHKIVLPGSSLMTLQRPINTKLLLLPPKDVTPDEIMLKTLAASEIIQKPVVEPVAEVSNTMFNFGKSRTTMKEQITRMKSVQHDLGPEFSFTAKSNASGNKVAKITDSDLKVGSDFFENLDEDAVLNEPQFKRGTSVTRRHSRSISFSSISLQDARNINMFTRKSKVADNIKNLLKDVEEKRSDQIKKKESEPK